ncbi:Potassium transporter 26 [Tetrabaena socialis]|uniref:Potassium transporter 26 n=1 Tax=Tetrabaena socialis TaxID=47790 RepID=A0A2J7ZXY9_9CHLO|nr:Potassium transporter 26 [Tetrabaena socialis]|eukprot:PNH05127.1 Potassium transporter 26 [Tetrabaena socialis]
MLLVPRAAMRPDPDPASSSLLEPSDPADTRTVGAHLPLITCPPDARYGPQLRPALQGHGNTGAGTAGATGCGGVGSRAGAGSGGDGAAAGAAATAVVRALILPVAPGAAPAPAAVFLYWACGGLEAQGSDLGRRRPGAAAAAGPEVDRELSEAVKPEKVMQGTAPTVPAAGKRWRLRHEQGGEPALSPAHIGTYFARHGAAAWRSLGAIMLCVTGTEALFADLGHFSRGSITVACGVLAYPCLVITYLGQVVEGGWFVLLIAALTSLLMFTWWAGSRRLGERLAAATAGARIRLLGPPQPHHPLLPPLPRPPQPAPKPPLLPSEPLLSRISSWALRRRGTSNSRGGSGGAGLGTAPAAASVPLPGEAPWRGLEMQSLPLPAPRRHGTGAAADRECAWHGLPPGTLALELPAGGSGRYGGGGGGGRAAVAAAADESCDVEMGPAAGAAAPLVVPLTRLSGVGVYYMDEKVGDADVALPPVLVHFLRNVQLRAISRTARPDLPWRLEVAIHSVCVFLSVRRLPLPSVSRRRRLHVFAPRNATPLNYYHVVSFYGYLDRVDHGPAFLNELLGAITRSLVAAAGKQQQHGRSGGATPAPPSSLWADSGFGADKGESDESARGAASAGGGGADEGSLVRTGVRSPKPAELLAWRGTVRPKDGTAGVALADEDGTAGTDTTDSAPTAAPGTGAGPDVWSVVESAAADFLQAQLHGVVYYASRAQLRSPANPAPASGPCRSWLGLAPLARWVVFGLLFRWLAAVAFVDMESWRVPPERLVELGMPVEIW